MTSINTNNIARIVGLTFAVFAMLAVGVALAPKAHAADLEDFGGSYVDYGSYTSPYSYGGGYGDSYVDYGSYTTPYNYGGYGDSYVDYGSYTTPYSSSFGGGFGGGGFGGSGFSGFGGFGGGRSSVVSTAAANTSIYAPTNTNTCTAPNTCNTSVDDHSIFNAPTTVTVSGGGSGGSYPVYVPTYQPQYPVYVPTYQPQYPVYTPPVVYPNPTRQPYVSLNQVPYTGLDLGPVGTVLYWGFLVFWVLLAAYLIVYKRVQTKVVAGLNSFLFGAPTTGTHAKVVMPTSAPAHKAYVAPAAKNDDAIDPFIASQISRNK